MHQRKYFTSNFLSMKYFLSKIFRTTVCAVYRNLLGGFLVNLETSKDIMPAIF